MKLTGIDDSMSLNRIFHKLGISRAGGDCSFR